MMALEKWKNFLRVRFVGGSRFDNEQLLPGAEGIVAEFFGPMGTDYWQVNFSEYGTLNVHRESIEIVDPEFSREMDRQGDAEINSMIGTAKEAVLYLTRKKSFKSLVVWHKDGRHDSIEQPSEAERMVKLLKQHRIPLAQEIWFN